MLFGQERATQKHNSTVGKVLIRIIVLSGLLQRAASKDKCKERTPSQINDLCLRSAKNSKTCPYKLID